jgi:hypothetical protein
MTRVNLKLNLQPGVIEAYLQFRAKAGHFEPKLGFIDTGAHVSLFPLALLDILEHRVIEEKLEIEQAGIAGQYFSAVEAEVTLYFEDLQGNQSQHLKVRAWFANTSKVIIGFQDILDRATLHVDYRQSRTGWIEL